MKDKDILADVLNTEKNMRINMATALNEASCNEVYNLYYDIFENISNAQQKLYNIGYNNSWYTVEQTPKTKIKDNYNKLKKEVEGTN